MEKWSKFKLLKLPSFFTSSCKTQNLDEIIDHGKNPIFTPQNPIFLHTPLMEELHDNEDEEEEEEEEEEKYPFHNLVIKPKQMNSSSSHQTSSSSSSLMCKPRCPETFDQMVRESCIISTTGNPFNRRKFAGKYSLVSPSGDFSGRRCPPTSPASPLFLKQGKKKKKKKKKKNKKKQKEKTSHFKNNYAINGLKSNPFSFSSSNETDDNGDWFSSDDEREDEDYVGDDEKQTMFSLKSMSFSSKSISLSSDSNIEYQTRVQTQTQTQTRTQTRPRRQKPGSRPKEVGVVPLEGKVKDTFAVVKSSSDPYNDFRTSMVEMIIEKQIFGAKELEQLLQCFLSLNSSHHHKVIVKVFNEICDALFSHCS